VHVHTVSHCCGDFDASPPVYAGAKRTGRENRNTAQKLGEKMYADMQAQQAADAAAGGTTDAGASADKPKEDDVMDAEFKEVKKLP
jgi:hypothetical protein